MVENALEVEIAVDSLDGAQTAAAAGADRLELCQALELGGVTPGAGLLETARAAFEREIVALVRPRPGHFTYRPDEARCVLADLSALRQSGADAVAIGALTPDAALDRRRLEEWAAAARPMKVVCHRAFDWTRDPFEALDLLIELGFDRVLTSGQKASAAEGSGLIRRLVERAAGAIEVVPAGGIDEGNLLAIAAETGARSLHFSAGAAVESPALRRNERVRFHPPGAFDDTRVRTTSASRVKAMTALAHAARPAGVRR